MTLATLGRLPRASTRGAALLWVIVVALLVVVALIVYLLRAPLLRAAAEAWIVNEPPEKAQAIVVLGGDNIRGDRLRHGVALYRAGWAPRLVLSGTPFRTYFHESELMKREATELGVPAAHLILAPTDATSTLEEALALRPLLAQHNFRKLIVVTSNFHTRRSRQIFRAVYRPLGTRVIVSAAPDLAFEPERWWEQRSGRKYFLLELLKTVHTWWELLTLPSPAEEGGQSLRENSILRPSAAPLDFARGLRSAVASLRKAALKERRLRHA
ncbi:MAG: YdcF family protein [Acidobacteria bacterium]|nr:YdcF family protein [Acidobacteriota bacterium]